jgi:hypothetical protein
MSRRARSAKIVHPGLFPDVSDQKPVASSSSVTSSPPTKQKRSRDAAATFATPKDLLSRYQIADTNKHIAHEFQSFGCYLAETLADKRHTALYIKLAKQMPRAVLEQALRFVIDSTADNKAKLFMWKLEQIKLSKQTK